MNSVESLPPYSASEQAKRLHQQLVIADLHADSLLWNRDLLEQGTYGHVDIPRLLEGNVAVQAFTVVTSVPRGRKITGTSADNMDLITPLSFVQLWPPSTWTSLKERALYQAEKLHDLAAQSDGRLLIVKSSTELEEFLERRKESPAMVGGFLGIEGAHCLEGQLRNVDVFFDAGFRMMSPSHFFDTEIGGSAQGEIKAGLSAFGKQVIRRMEELGMIVDLSHASADLIDDVLGISTRPIAVSHTGVKGTCDNQRNLSDKHLVGIAQTGGVIGIGYWQTATCGSDAEAIVKAIRYTTDLIGVEHVALGSDFDGATRAAFDTTGVVKITEGLLEQNFSTEEIRKIMGENVVRFLKQALPK